MSFFKPFGNLRYHLSLEGTLGLAGGEGAGASVCVEHSIYGVIQAKGAVAVSDYWNKVTNKSSTNIHFE